MNQLVINLLFAILQVSNLGLVTVLLYPLVHQIPVHQVHALNLGGSRKSMKFQSISNTSENHQTGLPRPPEVSKMRSKLVPKILKFTKMSKKWYLMKHQYLPYKLIGWDIRNQQVFHSTIDKSYAYNSNILFDDPNDRKSQKVIQNGVRKWTQNPSKIIQNPSWDLPGFLWVHLCPTLITKMVPK